MSNDALEKDIDRFVGRHIGKEIERIDGRLRIKPENDSSGHKLEQEEGPQTVYTRTLTIQAKDGKRKGYMHHLWFRELINHSPKAQETFRSFTSTKLSHKWEEMNPHFYVERDGNKAEVDKSNITFDLDNPHTHELILKFPGGYMKQEEKLLMTFEYDVRIDNSRWIRIDPVLPHKVTFDLLMKR